MAQTHQEVAKQESGAGTPVPVHQGGILDHFERLWQTVAGRAFEIFENRGKQEGKDLDDWLAAEQELISGAAVEISEKDGKLNIRAHVPGFNKPDLKVSVEPHRLLITGRAEESKEEKVDGEVHREHLEREIFQSIDLPAVVNTEAVSATLADGVLTIELTKAEA